MKPIVLILVTLTALTLAIGGCSYKSRYYDSRLTVRNHSGRRIAAFFSYNYPDTLLPATTVKPDIDANNDVADNGNDIRLARGGSWETAFTDQAQSGRLMVFVLDDSLLRNAPWDDIWAGNRIIKRFDVTLDDLKSSNFVLQVE